jgi:hypothetical protein
MVKQCRSEFNRLSECSTIGHGTMSSLRQFEVLGYKKIGFSIRGNFNIRGNGILQTPKQGTGVLNRTWTLKRWSPPLPASLAKYVCTYASIDMIQ